METTHIKNIESLYLGEKSNFFSVSSCGVQDKKNGLRPNHLGNVHLVLSDRKQTSTYDNTLAAYEYYPFGMAMQTYETDAYRYGFNGKEKDLEGIGGGGTTYDYGFRIYNPSLAKFLSVDPLSPQYPWYTPYQFAGNKPIQCIDLDGLEEFYVYFIRGQDGSKIAVVKLTNPSTSKLIVNVRDDGETKFYPSSVFPYKSLHKKLTEAYTIENGKLYFPKEMLRGTELGARKQNKEGKYEFRKGETFIHVIPNDDKKLSGGTTDNILGGWTWSETKKPLKENELDKVPADYYVDKSKSIISAIKTQVTDLNKENSTVSGQSIVFYSKKMKEKIVKEMIKQGFSFEKNNVSVKVLDPKKDVREGSAESRNSNASDVRIHADFITESKD